MAHIDDQAHDRTVARRQAYRMIGGAGERAQAAAANAEWYRCPVPRPLMKQLMQRGDARAIRDTLIWYAAIAISGCSHGWRGVHIRRGRSLRSSCTARSTAARPTRAGTNAGTAPRSARAG